MAIRCETHGSVAAILLDGRGQRNALGLEDWRELTRQLDRRRRDSTPAVVLGSAHPAMFCAGLDLEEVRASSADSSRAAALYDVMTAALDALERLPAMTLAAVDGAAVGAGCALAMACDMRVVGPSAVFRTPPAHLGLIYPAADVRRLIRGVGYARAMWMLSTGEAVHADRAASVGIALDLSTEPMADALRTAARIAAAVPGRFAVMKRAAASGDPVGMDSDDDRRGFVEALTSPETGARIRATRSSRPSASEPG